MKDYTPENVKAINEKTNELLLKYDNRSKLQAIDPSVDIMGIAKALGVKEVKYVSPDVLGGKHAIFEDGVVKIDKNDSNGQRVFDLAHEVGHIVFNYYTSSTTMTKGFKVVRQNTGELIIKPYITKAVVKRKAARQRESKKSSLTQGEQKIETFLDRFAANLLVPISLFQLFEDKTDKEIADAFHVEENCIKKRREEVKHELNVLTSEMKPCAVEDIADPDVKLDIDALLKESAIIDANR